MAVRGELGEVLRALGVKYIPVKKRASAFTFNNQPEGYHAITTEILWVEGRFWNPVRLEDLRQCLENQKIPIVAITQNAITIRYDQRTRNGQGEIVPKKDSNGLVLGKEIVITPYLRCYQDLKTRYHAQEDLEQAVLYT